MNTFTFEPGALGKASPSLGKADGQPSEASPTATGDWRFEDDKSVGWRLRLLTPRKAERRNKLLSVESVLSSGCPGGW